MVQGKVVAGTAAVTGQPKRSVAILLNALLDCIQRSLTRDGKVTFRGFGTFHVRARKPRRVVNPRTGEAMVIPARKIVRFRPGERLRSRIR